ncbi:MAG TPA: UDP-N-acetylglucosamine 1-carboxyvinyltransferase, partial [Candidatus Defluviicoccus seviourii]|nr:UDP-N-acetylglucosamine 1-carboxyvinyltransferase [Candidatus Defluviicoccus seviourii]
MKRIHIRGGTPLSGIIPISGAKNAALPLLAAGLLTEGTLTLDNVPNVVDIESMLALLAELGATVETDANTGTNGSGSGFGLSVRLSTPAIRSTTAVYDLVRKMRASVLVLGPLVARFGHARVSLPGGCAIGTRPIDLHLKALQAMGAEVGLDAGYVEVSAPKGLTGAVFTFPSVSVTGTENALMAAVLARGETRICNAAREPEIGDLARCLVAMGADITGIDTDTLKVQGVERL